ncbi:compound eye opsin BCRH2-like [Watersipora subatra]|uniref:compound eye opsin BCRH2-like n=1 Tax=Watersipora subatra TaxID=2589382 RepID=UPI00355BAFC9
MATIGGSMFSINAFHHTWIFRSEGIHKYVIEGRLSCSLDWNSGHLHAFIYNVVIFLSTFVLPLAVILCTNGQILYLVRRNFNPKSDSKRQSKQQKREWQMAKIVMEASGFYMLAWTPYGIVSMWSAFGDEKRIPNLAFTFLAFFAKLSFIFNPCVYCFNNPRHRKALSKMVFGKEISKRKHPARGEPAPVPESTQDNLNETEMMSDSDDLLAAHQSQSSDQLVVVVKRVEGGVEMDEHAV